jgi:TolA-binding protein
MEAFSTNVQQLNETLQKATKEFETRTEHQKHVETQQLMLDQLTEKINIMKRYSELLDQYSDLEAQIVEKQLIKENRLDNIRNKYTKYIPSQYPPPLPLPPSSQPVVLSQASNPPPPPPPPQPLSSESKQPIKTQTKAAAAKTQPSSSSTNQKSFDLQAALSEALNSRRASILNE